MEKLESLCKKWSAAVKKYNFSSVKYRRHVDKTLNDLPLEERKKAVKLLDEFIFNHNDLLEEEIGKLDDKIAESEKIILAVRKKLYFVI